MPIPSRRWLADVVAVGGEPLQERLPVGALQNNQNNFGELIEYDPRS